jgi:hypothetical protein
MGSIAGQSYESWANLWRGCVVNDDLQMTWPYPGTVMRQPAIVVSVFDMISSQVKAERKAHG